MCLLALFYRTLADAPVIVGANREEAYDRGGEPPRIIEGECRFMAGIDPRSGGTWLGVNERGLVVAVTNRLKTHLPATPRSRGLLARDLLGCHHAGAAAGLATSELGKNVYAGCNILCADASSAYVLHAGDWLRVRPLTPGLHVMSSSDVNDTGDRRLGHAQWWLLQRSYEKADDCVTALKQLCEQPGNPDPPMCLRGDKGGTVSSSIIALKTSLPESSYWHAQGPPDRTPYEDYSPMLHELYQSRGSLR